MTSKKKLTFAPLTPSRWPHFETLFGDNGACGGCWCTCNRFERAQYLAGRGEKNKRAMKRLVDAGRVPGILAFAGGECVGWCSIEPAERFAPLLRSRISKPL